MNMLIQVRIFIFLLATAVSGTAVFFYVEQHPAERVVQKMYRAQSDGDMGRYGETLVPTERNQNLDYLLGDLIQSITIGTGVIGLDLGELSKIDVYDLRVQIVAEEDGYALVRAEGVRHFSIFGDVPFCEYHDAVEINGRWYVSFFHPAREVRTAKLLADYEQFANSALNDEAYMTGTSIFGAFQDSMGVATNQCEANGQETYIRRRNLIDSIRLPFRDWVAQFG